VEDDAVGRRADLGFADDRLRLLQDRLGATDVGPRPLGLEAAESLAARARRSALAVRAAIVLSSSVRARSRSRGIPTFFAISVS
jgi:hypothetical protein